MQDLSEHIKCVLIGPERCGKTFFGKVLSGSQPHKRYIPTLGVDVSPFTIQTKKEKDFKFDLWDCAGQERYSGLKDGYYITSKAAIVMFSLNSRTSFKRAIEYIRTFRRMEMNAPIVLCGNIFDNKTKIIVDEYILRIKEKCNNIDYFEVSASRSEVCNIFLAVQSILNRIYKEQNIEVNQGRMMPPLFHDFRRVEGLGNII